MSTAEQDAKIATIKRVHEKRWDYLLAHLFLSIRHFPELSKKEDFDERLNIGLNNISTEKRLLQCGHIQESVNFVNASYQGINFSLGGFSNESYLPDGDPFHTLAIALWIQNKHIFTFLYHDRISAGVTAKDFDLASVEILNENPLIDKLLLGLENEMGVTHKKLKLDLTMAAKEYPASWSEIYY
jgi:hypothetical protein